MNTFFVFKLYLHIRRWITKGLRPITQVLNVQLSNMVLIKAFTCSVYNQCFLRVYSVRYNVKLFLNASTSSIFNNLDGNYFSPWWSEERSCIYKCYLMFVHFWISVDDIVWLSCFVIVYIIWDMIFIVIRLCKALWNKHSLMSNDGKFKYVSTLVSRG